MEVDMAGTERDIREMLARDQERRKSKPTRHTAAGTKIALDIQRDFKFPGDPSPTTKQTGDSDAGNTKKSVKRNPRARAEKGGKGKET